VAWWPDLSDYNDAIQYPDLCFDDPVLKGGTLALNGMLPRVASGNFATVYQLVCGPKTYAVKCFHRPCHPDQANRYARISDYLGRHQLDTFSDFDFVEQGIRVGGKQFPILKMEWVEGELLDKFVEKNHANSQAMRSLADQFGRLMADLKGLNIAHGDLQHGNVLVHDGNVKLIDYDGMFIPAFKGMNSYEIGHRNYQHPNRTPQDFDANLDHFAAWVIYLSLMALSSAPSLWDKVKNAGADCLLFHQKDFETPSASPTLTLIENMTDATIRMMVRDFRQFISSPLSGVPPLPAVNGSLSYSATSVVQTGLGWLKDHFPRRDTVPPLAESPFPAPIRIEVDRSRVTPDEMWWLDHVDSSATLDFAFSETLLDSEADIYLQIWDDTTPLWRYLMMSLRGFFRRRYETYHVVQQKRDLEIERTTALAQLSASERRLGEKTKEREGAIRDLQVEFHRIEDKIVELKAQIAATPMLERDEIAAATLEDRERHLKANALKSGAIAGFGAVRVQALNDMGILSAADINASNEKRVKQALSIVHRALPAREWRKLKRWREDIEAAYQPPQLVLRRVREIERRYDDLRSSIRQTINARQVELGIYGKRIHGNDRTIQEIDRELAQLKVGIDHWQDEAEGFDLDLEHFRDITFEQFLRALKVRMPAQPITPRAVSVFPLVLVGLFVMLYAVGFIFGNSQADDHGSPAVQSNGEWSILADTIEGVDMVLVPRGCFFYGGPDSDENPTGRYGKCINEPFWMDRYEVTNAAFGVDGNGSAATHPYESVTWTAARDYCMARGGRLPTEIEWEFAARGPDSLLYVWGDYQLTANELYSDNGRNRIRAVTDFGADVSWVGAVGMSGNVAEWTSTIFEDYPYTETDGRENPLDFTSPRVVRGGAFTDAVSDMVTSRRRGQLPQYIANGVGFRCVVDYQN
jgi:hypothetical protein